MAKDETPNDLMDYAGLHQDAMRSIIPAALRKVLRHGLPGDHHFYISFQTDTDGVIGPPEVLSRFPDEMTIVLQHQFWDLEVDDERFSVTLQFGGQPKVLRIPYRAITRFYDPTVQFVMQFDPPPRRAKPAAAPVSALPLTRVSEPPDLEDRGAAAAVAEDGTPFEPAPNIVSLDQFRRK